MAAGEVVAGNVGAKERFEYTVIGEPVNEAARLAELARSEPSWALASAETVAAASNASNGSGASGGRCGCAATPKESGSPAWSAEPDGAQPVGADRSHASAAAIASSRLPNTTSS